MPQVNLGTLEGGLDKIRTWVGREVNRVDGRQFRNISFLSTWQLLFYIRVRFGFASAKSTLSTPKRKDRKNEDGENQNALWPEFYKSVKVCDQVEAPCKHNQPVISRKAGCPIQRI